MHDHTVKKLTWPNVLKTPEHSFSFQKKERKKENLFEDLARGGSFEVCTYFYTKEEKTYSAKARSSENTKTSHTSLSRFSI